MFRKYLVYIDDGDSVMRIAIAAQTPEDAAKYCWGNGEIVAVKDVTEEYPISAERVCQALHDGGFSLTEIDYIIRTLTVLGVADYN